MSKGTHANDKLLALLAALVLSARGEANAVLEDRMLHLLSRPAVKRPAVEEQFPSDNAQGPPVARPCVT